VKGAEKRENCDPYSVEINESEGGHIVTWKTGKECVGYIRHSNEFSFTDISTARGDDGFSLTKEHRVFVSEDARYFAIVSDEVEYGDNGALYTL